MKASDAPTIPPLPERLDVRSIEPGWDEAETEYDQPRILARHGRRARPAGRSPITWFLGALGFVTS
ncbi:MAG: hypothetical protein KC621_12575 [Myxococcales bacterium]|nr:hypothetical protein [Myxococcales bacterium]